MDRSFFYGMIKGAKAYIVGIMKNSKGSDVHASFDFGCDFEKVVLKATEKLVRFFAKSDKGKSWDEIFFNLDDTMPLTRTDAGLYAEPLEMLRLAPSASNSQPWRIIKRNNKYEFYSASSSITSKPDQKIDLSYNDVGIAKAHFELTAKALGLDGEWQMIDGDMSGFGELTYIGSWTCK